jgi:hypothetical protein
VNRYVQGPKLLPKLYVAGSIPATRSKTEGGFHLCSPWSVALS